MQDRTCRIICAALIVLIALCVGAIAWMIADIISFRAPDYRGARYVREAIEIAPL